MSVGDPYFAIEKRFTTRTLSTTTTKERKRDRITVYTRTSRKLFPLLIFSSRKLLFFGLFTVNFFYVFFFFEGCFMESLNALINSTNRKKITKISFTFC